MTDALSLPPQRASSRPSTAACMQASACLFIALWPGPHVRQALAACRDLARPAGSSPVATEKLHLTLHFIGNVPPARVAEVAAALAVPVQTFMLCLDVTETWRGGLVVLRPATVPPRLRALHANLAAALRGLALPVEARDFRPHVTLARRAAPQRSASAAGPVPWRVTGHALVCSQPDGQYRVLQRYR